MSELSANPEMIKFARRHAYEMREGFFDGVNREGFEEVKALLDESVVEQLESSAVSLSHDAGITLEEAWDAIAESTMPDNKAIIAKATTTTGEDHRIVFTEGEFRFENPGSGLSYILTPEEAFILFMRFITRKEFSSYTIGMVCILQEFII
jgi:hypothetical protein